jgi:hypothetical protein
MFGGRPLASLISMHVPLPRLRLVPWEEADFRSIGVEAGSSCLVVVIEPDALLRPVLVEALRASLDATVVECDSLARLRRLVQTFTPDLVVVDPAMAYSLDGLEQRTPVLFTDVPPAGALPRADRYAVLARPFQLEDFTAAAQRLRVMQPA